MRFSIPAVELDYALYQRFACTATASQMDEAALSRSVAAAGLRSTSAAP